MYAFGEFRLDPGQRRLLKNGEVLPLTAKTFELLVALVESAGELVTRAELMEILWPRTVVEEHSLTWYVSALRKALADEGDAPEYIETVRGQGYRFIAPVAVIDDPAPASTAPPQQRQRFRFIAIAGALVIVAAIGTVAAGFHFSDSFDERPTIGTGPSIAVLPFESLGSAGNNAWFANGIQDTILTKLAGIADLRVISRTSTEQYASRPENLKIVAKQLGVTSILEGSVQKTGDNVLINVQLIDARTDSHLWAQTYRRTLDDVFDVESEIARQVAAALEAQLLPEEAARIASAPTEDPKAYELFLKAEYLAIQVEEGTAQEPAAAMIQAVDLYKRAITQDPGFALAYARLSYLEGFGYWFHLDHLSSRIEASERAAKRALALEPDLPQAHLAMGFVHYFGQRNYSAALAEFELADKSLPNNASVIAAIAFIHRRQGKWQQALEGLKRASLLDPRNPWWPEEVANTLTALRRYADAETAYKRALAIKPLDYNSMVRRIGALLFAGDLPHARQALENIPRDVDPEGLVSAIKFEAAWMEHKPRAALAALEGAPAWLQVARLPGRVPTSFLRARALAAGIDKAAADEAYRVARADLEDALKERPDDPTLWSVLGLVYTALGKPSEALRAGHHATILLPVSADAYDGPAYQTRLAEIYARLGDADSAIKLLERLLAQPTGEWISIPLLKLDPVWDGVRSDPRFQALLKGFAAQASSAGDSLSSTDGHQSELRLQNNRGMIRRPVIRDSTVVMNSPATRIALITSARMAAGMTSRARRPVFDYPAG